METINNIKKQFNSCRNQIFIQRQKIHTKKILLQLVRRLEIYANVL